MNKIHKVIIIGGGFAGLSASIYASRAMLSPVLFEGEPGGQLMLTSDVENYPGFDEPILGPELMSRMRKQALRFGTDIITKKIIKVERKDSLFNVTGSDNNVYQSNTVLITTGSQAKWLEIESETKLRGRGVSACATCDGFFFKGKDVVVIGGGDSAMEEATYLTKFASHVTVIHRRETFKASVYMQEKAKTNEKISFLLNTEVLEILGTEKVEGIKVTSNGNTQEIKTDGVFVAIGHVPATSFLQSSGIKLDEKGYIYTTDRVRFEQISSLFSEFSNDYMYQTNIKGLFAAGDCVDFRFKQAATASGSAVGAVLEIEKYLHTL